MYSKITIETPVKGGHFRVSCNNALQASIQICIEQYNQKRGMCITRGFPIPNKVEFIFNDVKNEIQEIRNLNFEGEHRNVPHEVNNPQIKIIS